MDNSAVRAVSNKKRVQALGVLCGNCVLASVIDRHCLGIRSDIAQSPIYMRRVCQTKTVHHCLSYIHLVFGTSDSTKSCKQGRSLLLRGI